MPIFNFPFTLGGELTIPEAGNDNFSYLEQSLIHLAEARGYALIAEEEQLDEIWQQRRKLDLFHWNREEREILLTMAAELGIPPVARSPQPIPVEEQPVAHSNEPVTNLTLLRTNNDLRKRHLMLPPLDRADAARRIGSLIDLCDFEYAVLNHMYYSIEPRF